MRRAQDGEFLDLGRQRDRAPYPRPGALSGVDNLAGRLIEHPVVVGSQANADVLIINRHLLGPILRPPISAFNYFMILATTPAPTVRPPSRMAKRKPSSIAI